MAGVTDHASPSPADFLWRNRRASYVKAVFRTQGLGTWHQTLVTQASRRCPYHARHDLENAMLKPPVPSLQHVCDLSVTIAAPIEVGHTPMGRRRLIPITGGRVSGPKLNGTVLNAGADFQLIVADGCHAHLDARYIIETEDGARIWVHNTALRVASLEDSQRIANGQAVDPERVYFRCQPRFEAADPKWAWLNEHQFVGSGARAPDGVFLSFYQVL